MMQSPIPEHKSTQRISTLLFLVSVFLNGRLYFLASIAVGKATRPRAAPQRKFVRGQYTGNKTRRRKEQRKGDREETGRREDKWCISTSIAI